MPTVVVGLGAMGSAAAFHLVRQRIDVIGFDRFHPPHDRGSSHGESRIFREAYFEDPQYVPLVRRSLELWLELASASGEKLLRRSGALMVGPARGSVVPGASQSARLHGVAHERLARNQAATSFPFLELPEGFEVLYEPGAGVLVPERCISAHLAQARALGADLRPGVEVRGWTDAAGRLLVHTDQGDVAANHIVLCAGAWLPSLLADLPLEVERQVMLWFAPRGDVRQGLPAEGPAFLWEATGGELYYGIPEAGGLLKAARHHGGRVAAIEALDRTVSPDDVAPVRAFLEAHFPGSAGPLRRGVVCSYTNSPDGHFIIAPSSRDPRVTVVSACSGHGFKFASAIGEAVARRVSGLPDALDLSAFALPRPG